MDNIIQIYSIWYIRLFMANIREVGALITVKDKLQHFSYPMITGSDSSPKQSKVVIAILAFRAGARDFLNYFRKGLLGA